MQGRKVGQPVWQVALPGWLKVESEEGAAVERSDLALTGGAGAGLWLCVTCCFGSV